MESIIARALEYTLKYWLKSFSRDQFKLQGRTAQLSNLDINGDALHASVGLPPALNVTTARVGKLEITLPSVSNVQIEPIVVQIDRLDLVLEENADSDGSGILGSAISAASSTKGSGYGYADKIADGITLGVRTVNLLIETRGGAHCQSGATWASPLASITIRNLLLYTTNENWQVVNLKEAREFSNNKKFIYVFKKLEWESLSVDLLPHPDMFTDERFSSSDGKGNKRDDDGAKRLFFGGERFLEGISGEAYITIQRTELNSPLGLEVQLHVTEAVCPALSEPGLRALLRFMTGMYVCLNRGDVDLAVRQRHTEAAGCSLVSILVDHIFLCIKDTEFQLEVLMQSLFFSRASVSDGKITKNLSHVMIAGMFLRDTFSRPPCTLIQPSMEISAKESLQIPDFAQNFCPPIYPLGDYQWRVIVGVPLVSLYALQVNPPPAPPHVASQAVIECQPILIDLQEASCLRIASFLADGIVVSPGAILPDFYVKSFSFVLKGFDLIVPLDAGRTSDFSSHANYPFETFFSGAKLHVEDLLFSESPFLTCKLLNLEKDPACFPLWPGQPIDASQRKWRTQISHLSLSLKTCNDSGEKKDLSRPSTSFWTCVELRDACFEAAMVTADGTPLATLPPPEGIVRIGISCQQYLSNTSVDQLFFVLDVYTYFGNVSEEIKKIGKTSKRRSEGESLSKQLVEKIPSDTAVSLIVRDMRLKFVESSSLQVTMPLVQFGGDNLLLKVGHRTLGGAFAVTTNLTWSSIQVDCVDSYGIPVYENDIPDDGQDLLVNGNGYPQMKAVFWTDTRNAHQVQPQPFLDIAVVHVIPFNIRDMECHSLNVFTKIAGVRLGGGMNYTEILLHRFGIFGRDGGPGEGLQKGLKHLSSGPLANLFRSAPLAELNLEENINETECSTGVLELGKPDDVDICIELKDWLFALEGADDIGEEWLYYSSNGIKREELFWHTTFKNLQVKAKSGKQTQNRDSSSEFVRATNFPVELMTVSIEGLQALKPHARNVFLQNGISPGGNNSSDGGMRILSDNAENKCGINLELSLGTSPDLENPDMVKWAVENIKFSVKEPIEAVATKEELEQLVLLCRSEFDSVGRIAAGFLRIFKLEDSLGKGAIDQLSNLGSESLDRIFTPDKLSRRSSIASVNYTPSSTICETPRQNVESTISRLENVLADSQAKCSALVVEFSNPEISAQHLADVKQLNQKLESLQVLLMKLRTQI